MRFIQPLRQNMKQFKQWVSLLLVLTLVLSMVYVGPAVQAEAASASSYISATYASSLSIKTTKITTLREGPSEDAAAGYTVAADTMLTVKALHKNTAGEYWYQVRYYNLTLYVKAVDTAMVDHLTGDVTVADLVSPAAIGTGQGFPIGGTITSSLNKLGKITAAVHYYSNIYAAPAISASDTPSGNSYSLTGSNVDMNLTFGSLAAGSYTYMLTAEAVSYYINSSGVLTTSSQTVVLDNKPLVVTTANVTNPITAVGIDVSTWQGNIDWAKVATQVDFAILRLGYSTSLDGQFINNASGCNANGVPFGVYHYSYALTEAEAIAEAEYVISVLSSYDVDLPVFFDIEDESQAALGATAIKNITKAFCDTIRDAGYEPGLYTFLSWFNSYFTDSYYCSMPKWVAQISSSCSYAKGVTMWQYSWTGSFDGISGDVDCNYYFGEFPGKNSDPSYLSKCTYYPSNMDITLPTDLNMRKYPTTDYGVIEVVPAGTTLQVTGLYENSYGNWWYQVNKDGVTGYMDTSFVTIVNHRFDDLSVVDPTMKNLALGIGYNLQGKLGSVFNNLYKVNAKVYSGEDTTASPVLSSSATVNAKEYNLYYSDVCDNLTFSKLAAGYYTYEISADVKNYYVDSSDNLLTKTENVVLWTAPMTIGGATVTPPASLACDHTVVDQAAVDPGCTTTGLTAGSYCSKCGEVFAEQAVVPAVGHNYTSTTYPPSCLEAGRVDYTCSRCGDTYSDPGAMGDHVWADGVCGVCGKACDHDFVDDICTVCGMEDPTPDVPVLNLLGATLSFQDEIYYKVIFNVTNPDSVEITEMGLITWETPVDGTIENAQYIIPGNQPYGSDLTVRSQGIPAKNMGDELYFKVYLRLADGTYIYSIMRNYSAKTYAMRKLQSDSTSAELKALCAALLNYGSAAQTYFGYNANDLMDNDMTLGHYRLLTGYSDSLLDNALAADSGKTAAMTYNGGYSRRYPSVNFGGAFAINYVFTPSYAVEGEMKLYVWDAETYASAQVLDASNASQVITMERGSNGAYSGKVAGIAAKDVDKTIYVCGVYESGGVTYRTGVLHYSLADYCESQVSNAGDAKALAEATAIYCYYAKQYLL